MIHAFEPLIFHLASDTPFRATLATDPEATLTAHGLALTDAERELLARLRPLLALPADALFQRLLDDGPDSQFVLLVRNLDWETQCGEYWLLPATGGDLSPVAAAPVVAPAWSPQGGSLAFLAGDACTLAVLDAETWMTRQVPLPGPATGIFWRPQGDGLAVQSDGSLWWIRNLAVASVESLTPPLPAVRDVRWSPDGDHLAFVSATDLYVVNVR